MATYGGVNIFGKAVRMMVRDTPTERQETAYPGVSGVESIGLGSRGRFVEASGTVYGVNAAARVAAEAVWRSYKDGVARPLVDTDGVVWPWAVLESFDPSGKPYVDGRHGYCRDYTARFRLLT